MVTYILLLHNNKVQITLLDLKKYIIGRKKEDVGERVQKAVTL